MQSETLSSNDIEGLNADTFIPNALPMVELGKKLLLAAKNGDTESGRQLMYRGAPFTTDWLGTSALHLAAQNNHVETAEMLLNAGISRDARTKVDRTPLHMAAYEGHNEMALLLLNYGADVDSRDMLKMTPLHWAVEREHIEVIHVLLEHGANPEATSKFDKTPISLALEHNRLDFVAILQQKLDGLQTDQVQLVENREDAHGLMQMEAETEEEQHQLELEQQQQQQHQQQMQHQQQLQQQQQQLQQQKRKEAQAKMQKKQKIVFQQIHVSPTSDEEQEKDSEIDERINSIEHSTLKKHKDMGGFNSLEQPLRLLQAHGITMIPVDNDSSIVENAMESGRTVVLTEAGKLALNLTRTSSIGMKRLQVGSRKGTPRKVIAIRADQILGQNSPVLTSRGPNILKRNNIVESKSGKLFLAPISNNTTVTSKKCAINSSKKKGVMQSNNQNPIILHLDDDIEEITEDDNPVEENFDPPSDNATLSKQLIETRRALSQCRKELQMKDEVIDMYKQTIEKLSQQRHSE
ncbi:hypothetical protein PV328_002831 [Microctonus aethiopoides]|uniref:Uncharacterized protein n=1 Tax=Microctonus aethiopoides TaxID=144406 RepID=A0AA39KJZ5_9HYME|nr:hypothetical protein PV328_002831 [Microctonus aethiopoides]